MPGLWSSLIPGYTCSLMLKIPLEVWQEVFSYTNHKTSHRLICYQPFLSQKTLRGTNQTQYLLKTVSEKASRGTVLARTKGTCSFHAEEQLCNLLNALDRHMDSNPIKVHPCACLAKWAEKGIMVAECGLESWLQNQNLYQTNRDFFKSLLTSLTLPSFWKHTFKYFTATKSPSLVL